MAQQYGFRSANNLSEVLDRNVCLDNLGIDTRDLPLLVGTSNAGVTPSDYQAIIGLISPLEGQLVTLTSGTSASLASLSQKLSKNGDVCLGSIFAAIVNNDRPYYDAGNILYGPSTASFFSPTNASGFNSGAEYKLGTIVADTTTVSGFNYTGAAAEWNNYFVRYKQFLKVQEQPSWTERKVPLFLAPPSTFSSNVLWLDSEYSEFIIDGASIEQWKDVLGRGTAVQTTAANKPVYSGSSALGKPAIIFDGSNDFFTLGNIGYTVPNGATLIIVASVGEPGSRGDTDFNIFGTLNNTSNRWRTSSGAGTWGLFATSLISSFPSSLPINGTYVWSVLASQNYGMELKSNGQTIDRRLNSPVTAFTYTGGDTWTIGANANGSAGFFQGSIFAIALFNKILSNKELRSVEEYFAWRYNFIYDPDRTQAIELEDGSPLETEGSVTFILG